MSPSDQNKDNDTNFVWEDCHLVQPTCPACKGSGQLFGVTFPIILSLIGLCMAWYGWANIKNLVSPNSNGHDNQFIMLLCFGGPALVLYAWWKCLWLECDECKGYGKLRRDSTNKIASHKIIKGDLIVEDQECHLCGYNVRTKCVGERCPECGEAIINQQSAEQYKETRRIVRSAIFSGLFYVVGMIVMSLLFGTMGAGIFMAACVLLTIVQKGISCLTHK